MADRNERIEKLSFENPDIPVDIIAKIVDATAKLTDDVEVALIEQQSMRANKIISTMDPMYT